MMLEDSRHAQLPSRPTTGPIAVPAAALAPATLAQRIQGLWYAGERTIGYGDGLVHAHVWFRFGAGGRATLTLRWDEGTARWATGRWRVEQDRLAVDVLAETIVHPPRFVVDNLMRWGDYTLQRQDVGSDPS